MDALSERIKNRCKMAPASELTLFDTGGYLMNKAKWKNKKNKEEEEKNRKTENDISGIIKARNKAGKDTKKYKPVKRREL